VLSFIDPYVLFATIWCSAVLVSTQAGSAGAVMGLSWGADHRVVDGASLARASNTLKAFLEQPERMLLHMA
jgi:pyruvate/2-oxoglutarate dehydrogenase complex dihydrolipoamide acyltransferase (E2) component